VTFNFTNVFNKLLFMITCSEMNRGLDLIVFQECDIRPKHSTTSTPVNTINVEYITSYLLFPQVIIIKQTSSENFLNHF
jgi:hypothetical protein